MIKRWLFSVVAVVSASCNAEPEICPTTRDGYPRLSEDLSHLRPIPLDQISDTALNRVQQCHGAHPYISKQHTIYVDRAGKAPNGNTYLFFHVYGATDVQLVFVLNEDDRLIQAHQYSTL